MQQGEVGEKSGGIKIVQTKQWPCAQVNSRYKIFEEELGRGTYGSVYKARNLYDDKCYALKKMQNFQDKNEMGFPITTIRQIKILQGLNHPNILNIKQVVYQRGRSHKPPIIYISLDLMECDILQLIKNSSYKMTTYRIQQMLKQILTGLEYLHQFNISHRDIKPSNILISADEVLKIADFGLAKKLKKLSTTKVVTMWYRAPQLLLGVKTYTPKVDIWSVGCVAAQMLLKKPLFQTANTESELINKIYELTGTPDSYGWQQQLALQGKNYPELKPSFSGESTIIHYLRERAPEFQSEYQLMDLIEKMMRLNHNSRFSASECLSHDFFKLKLQPDAILSADFMQERRAQKQYGSSARKKVHLI